MVKKVKGHRFNVPSVAQGGKDAPGVGGTRGVHRWADPGVVPGILRPAGDGVKAPAQRAAPHVERPDDALGRVGAMVVGHRGPDDHQVSDDDRRGRDTVFPMLFRLVAEAHGQVDRSVRGEVVAWPAGADVQRRESRADRGHEDAQRAGLTRSPAHPRGGAPVPVREIAVVVADADRTLVLPPLGTGGGVERDHAAQWRGRVQRPVHQDGRGFEAAAVGQVNRPCAPPTRAARISP